jgi:hypothetical protein
VSLLPWYISSGLLALMLVIREWQHQKTVKGLLDRILESKGMTALPDNSPVGDFLSQLKEKAQEPVTEEQKRLLRTAKERVHFKIPNMPEMRSK